MPCDLEGRKAQIFIMLTLSLIHELFSSTWLESLAVDQTKQKYFLIQQPLQSTGVCYTYCKWRRVSQRETSTRALPPKFS